MWIDDLWRFWPYQHPCSRLVARQYLIDIATPVRSATNVPGYVLRALKVLFGWPRHELINQADRIAEVWSSDSQVYEASDNLSKPFQVSTLLGVGGKLHGSVQRS